jgi:ubiquitin-protein ligase
VLKEKWSMAMRADSAIEAIKLLLLGGANVDSPQNKAAATMMVMSPDEYEQKIRTFYSMARVERGVQELFLPRPDA